MDYTVKIISSNFNDIYDDLVYYCRIAEIESQSSIMKRNMKGFSWENYPESLLYKIFKTDTYKNGNGLLILIYKNNKIISTSTCELYNKDIVILLKRLYILNKFRGKNRYNFTVYLPNQLKWAKEKNAKVCIWTVNTYNEGMIKLTKRIKNHKGVLLGKSVILEYNDFIDNIVFHNDPIFFNNQMQMIVSYNLDSNFKFTLEMLK